MRRDTKLTAKTADEICEALRRGHYLKSAAAHAGIPRRTLSKWIEQGNEFRAAQDQRPVREAYANAVEHRKAVAAWRSMLARKQLYIDFADAVELAMDQGEAWLLEQTLAMIQDENVRNNKWTGYITILERTRRERWGRRSSVEHGTPDGQPFPVSHIFDPSKLSTVQLEQLKELLELAQPESAQGGS